MKKRKNKLLNNNNGYGIEIKMKIFTKNLILDAYKIYLKQKELIRVNLYCFCF